MMNSIHKCSKEIAEDTESIQADWRLKISLSVEHWRLEKNPLNI